MQCFNRCYFIHLLKNFEKSEVAYHEERWRVVRGDKKAVTAQ